MSKIQRLGPTAQLQLRIELEHSQPLIWRTVVVPSNITLVKLHSVIQAAMGWWGGHLHEFVIDHCHYGQVFDEAPFLGMEPELVDERRKKLINLLGRKRQFEYLYDFGDNWWHKLRVEGVLPLTTTPRPQILCLAGEMACPPEDVGGLVGYFEFLAAATNPLHEEHEAMIEWCGGHFDPTDFDITLTNQRLQHIKC
ncbi:hypothetical protein BI364_10275 [Acidihalobacter yilgarnensis]|uniref:Plasmid pRiA4b Orf3-like domain-containing protein n=1 Tax=Acidihalobacter yilgarnensis TaxID=2819280 RepID=A0A1D8IPF9_9GAMM|nr:plasmid pRiA4b ORF-3 family protein [Acidihalobacter yilgarnensis]AOU98295.1 hypothetical protein BI364_10275 [Acidihalobacter yilgarnensis]